MKSEQFQTFLFIIILKKKKPFHFPDTTLTCKKVTHSYICSDILLHSVDKALNIQSAWLFVLLQHKKTPNRKWGPLGVFLTSSGEVGIFGSFYEKKNYFVTPKTEIIHNYVKNCPAVNKTSLVLIKCMR